MNLIIGTAGHIDHGKTALVRAITGIDADRLPEEKQRGITIDLGFADLRLGDLHIGFVDVPGHERFIKNMLAGAGGIDLVMLVVAADEGIMPQTREHFEICRLLGISAGIVVLTKSDLAENEMMDLVKIDISEMVAGSFLESAPIVTVSAKTGAGIGDLKKAFVDLSNSLPPRRDDAIARLPIDRSFTVKGFGAVVTGTLISGRIRDGDEMVILPQQNAVRVRGIQTHGQSATSVTAGRRVAVNLAGINHGEIRRGMLLSAKDVLRPSFIFNASLEVLRDAKRSIRSRQRIRVHLGAAEVLGRIHLISDVDELEPGQRDHVQIRLESPIAAVLGDRFVVRNYSPQETIAGGVISDPLASKHRKADQPLVRVRLSRLADLNISEHETLRVFIEGSGTKGLTCADLQARTGWSWAVIQNALDELVRSDQIAKADLTYVSMRDFEAIKANLLERVSAHHKSDPLSKGINRELLRSVARRSSVAEAALLKLQREKKIEVSADVVFLPSREHSLSAEDEKVKRKLVEMISECGLEVPKLDNAIANAISGTRMNTAHARKLLQLAVDAGELAKISDEFYVACDAIESLTERLRKIVGSGPENTLDVPKFKEIAGVSRKYAIPLLEYFDREKVTIRVGDKRMLR